MKFFTNKEKKLLLWLLTSPKLISYSIQTKNLLSNLKNHNFIKIAKTDDGGFKPTINLEKIKDMKNIIPLPFNDQLTNHPSKTIIGLGIGLLVSPITSHIKVKPTQQISIESNVENTLDDPQSITYYVEIHNESGTTVSFDSVNETINSHETKKLSIPWTPEIQGNYTASVTLIKSENELIPITETKVIKIQVK